MNKFGDQSGPKPSPFSTWIAPLAAPFVVVLIQHYLLPVAFLLPLSLVVILCYLALRLPPSAMLVWTAFYIAFGILAAQVEVEPPVTSAAWRPYVRSGFVAAGGITAILLAGHRVRMRRSNEALFKVIALLPSAVIISDVSGNILLLNDECRKLLADQLSGVSKLSFFTTFVAAKDQGREIAKYVGYFEREEGGPYAATLKTRGPQPMLLEVAITIVTLDKTRYAVTVVDQARREELVTAA